MKKSTLALLQEAEEKLCGLKADEFWTSFEIGSPQLVRVVCPKLDGSCILVRRNDGHGHDGGSGLTKKQIEYMKTHGVERRYLWKVPKEKYLSKRKPS